VSLQESPTSTYETSGTSDENQLVEIDVEVEDDLRTITPAATSADIQSFLKKYDNDLILYFY